MPTQLRPATPHDVEAIIRFDAIAQHEPTRVEFIRTSVQNATCLVAVEDGQVTGYGVLEYSFFGLGFISMLYVHPAHRRRGVGSALMQALERRCTTAKLFTSTNRSNTPMQALLATLGFSPSGIIENLDEDDPELIYFKLRTA
jgi:ribosomal protein S18 acetylase RimI-like enzyme